MFKNFDYIKNWAKIPNKTLYALVNDLYKIQLNSNCKEVVKHKKINTYIFLVIIFNHLSFMFHLFANTTLKLIQDRVM